MRSIAEIFLSNAQVDLVQMFFFVGKVMVIKPTVGRILWYYRTREQVKCKHQPNVAIIAHVHDDRCINIALFDSNGGPYSHPPTFVTLVQEGDELPESNFCTWIPCESVIR